MLLGWTLLLVSSLLLLLAASVRRIPEGKVYSLYRFGRPRRMLDAGLHMVWPLLDRVVHKISLTGHVLKLHEVPVDEGSDPLRGTVYWQVLDPDRADSVIEKAEDLVRDTSLQLWQHHRDLPGPRDGDLKKALNEDLGPRGILVTRVQLG